MPFKDDVSIWDRILFAVAVLCAVVVGAIIMRGMYGFVNWVFS